MIGRRVRVVAGLVLAVMGVVVMAGCAPSGQALCEAGKQFNAEFKSTASVKVGSFNILARSLEGVTGASSWATRLPLVAQTIIDSGASVIGLQEAGAISGGQQQGQDVADRLNTIESTTKWKVIEPRYPQWEAILYDSSLYTPQGDRTEVPVVGPVAESLGASVRMMLVQTFRHIESRYTFIFASTHLHTSYGQTNYGPTVGAQLRIESGTIIADYLGRIRTLTKLPVLVVADWNTLQGSDARGVLEAAGFLDAKTRAGSTTGATLDTYNGLDPSMSNRQGGAWVDGLHTTSDVAVSAIGLQVKYASGSSLPLASPLPSDHNMVVATVAISHQPRAPASQAGVGQCGSPPPTG